MDIPARSSAMEAIRASVRLGRRIDIRSYRRDLVVRRIEVRRRALGLDSLEAYASYLAAHREELAELLKALTIHVTEFLRNREVFDWLALHVLPDLLRAAPVPLQVWSAGCATGDEPYSVALLLEALPEFRHRVPLAEIVATDIDESILETAREAVYGERNLTELSDGERRRWFERRGDERYHLRAPERVSVRFEPRDIEETPPGTRFDLVLCRNTLIFFEPETQDRILRRLAQSLRPDGCLVLGRVERLTESVRSTFVPLHRDFRVYRKLSGGSS